MWLVYACDVSKLNFAVLPIFSFPSLSYLRPCFYWPRKSMFLAVFTKKGRRGDFSLLYCIFIWPFLLFYNWSNIGPFSFFFFFFFFFGGGISLGSILVPFRFVFDLRCPTHQLPPVEFLRGFVLVPGWPIWLLFFSLFLRKFVVVNLCRIFKIFKWKVRFFNFAGGDEIWITSFPPPSAPHFWKSQQQQQHKKQRLRSIWCCWDTWRSSASNISVALNGSAGCHGDRCCLLLGSICLKMVADPTKGVVQANLNRMTWALWDVLLG